MATPSTAEWTRARRRIHLYDVVHQIGYDRTRGLPLGLPPISDRGRRSILTEVERRRKKKNDQRDVKLVDDVVHSREFFSSMASSRNVETDYNATIENCFPSVSHATFQFDTRKYEAVFLFLY